LRVNELWSIFVRYSPTVYEFYVNIILMCRNWWQLHDLLGSS